MAALAFRDPRLEAAVERAWARSRLSLRTRVDRLVDKSWHVVQCAVAAGVAWWFASGVLHHAMPFFAPIVAVVCLGMTYGQRLRRVAEVTVGVAVGIAVADIFVGVVGSGPWQITVVVLVSMSLALLLDAGLLLVMQSAVQSIVVTVLVPTGSQALGRWVDAVIGGVVALVGRVMARLLREAAQSAREGDVERSAQVLADARQTDPLIRELQAAADEGMSVIASTPFTRTDAGSVRSIASVVDPLDRAMRSTRVLEHRGRQRHRGAGRLRGRHRRVGRCRRHPRPGLGGEPLRGVRPARFRCAGRTDRDAGSGGVPHDGDPRAVALARRGPAGAQRHGPRGRSGCRPTAWMRLVTLV